jgi:hypothetical protein
MPFTEVIIPNFKQDSSTRDVIQKVWPSASDVFHHTASILSGQAGQVVLKNGMDVRDGLNLMCLFGELKSTPFSVAVLVTNCSEEWESQTGFDDFMSTKDMETFIGHIGPLLAEPPTSQLFRTNATPRDLAESPITEIVRLPADSNYPRDSVWEQLIATIETHSGHAHPSIFGHSVNLEAGLWLGILTWDSEEVRANMSIYNRSY